MGRLSSYLDVGKSVASFADAWKEKGLFAVWLHKEPPWTRALHSFRKVVTEETRDGIVARIRWLPFVCWEAEDFHRKRRFEKENPPHAKICPGCRLIEHLEHRTDLPSDKLVFAFAAGKERRDLTKADLVGTAKGKDAFQDDFTAMTEFLISVIPYDDPTKVVITNEKWSLGKELRNRIAGDIKLYGDEDGNPERRPLAYVFGLTKGGKGEISKYSVSRYVDAKLTPRVRELWAGPPPDLEAASKPGNPKLLLESAEKYLEPGVDLPLDEIFGPALESWKEDEEEATDFDPAKLEAENQAAAKASAEAKTESPPTNGKAEANGKPEEAKASTPPVEEPPPAKKTRGTKKTPPPPPPPVKEVPKDVAIFTCETCGFDKWREDEPKCPKCGATAEDAPEEPPPPRNEKRKF